MIIDLPPPPPAIVLPAPGFELVRRKRRRSHSTPDTTRSVNPTTPYMLHEWTVPKSWLFIGMVLVMGDGNRCQIVLIDSPFVYCYPLEN